MRSSLTERLAAVNPKPLSMRVALGGPDGKVLSDDEALREHGQILARAFSLAGYTGEQVRQILRYANQGEISKWVTGLRPAPIHRLFAQLPNFRAAYVQALAEREAAEGNPDVHVETTVRVRMRRSA